MTRRIARALARFAAAIAAFGLVAQPAMAQSISILRDAETEAFMNDLARPLVEAAKLDPKSVQVLMTDDPSINAFVAGGQIVYINAGLIEAADNANELQGVIAHELGHVADGHSINDGGAREATGISLLSLLLGVAAMAAGGGDAGLGVMMAGQRAAIGKYLAFTRVQEATADASGAKYLAAAGISGKGSISFFKKLQNYEYRMAVPQTDSFEQTHPLSRERIQILEDSYRADPAWSKPIDPTIEARFERVKAKLIGYIGDPKQTLAKYPETMRGIPARYARAYAWHKAAYPEKAFAEAKSLVDENPKDPYFLELYGQILLESGKPAQAIAPLREATRLTNNQPLIAATFGHALIATEDKANYPEAERVLKAAVARDNDNPFAWYQLGTIYAAQGDDAHASLARAEQSLMEQAPDRALQSAARAMAGLKQGTPDYLRAQDIKMIAEARLEDKRKSDRQRQGGLYFGSARP